MQWHRIWPGMLQLPPTSDVAIHPHANPTPTQPTDERVAYVHGCNMHALLR